MFGSTFCHEEQHEQILCPQCDLVVSVPELAQGTMATVHVVNTLLTARWRQIFISLWPWRLVHYLWLLMASPLILSVWKWQELPITLL